ncbi:hypothetical protein R6Q59_019028 [Mikania micrantha]
MTSSSSSLSLIFFCFMFRLISISDAIVPPNETFHYVNNGDLFFGNEYLIYDSEYAPTYRVLPPYIFPFRLCFYNTTPNAYTLALRMGRYRGATVMPWVWEANRGKPVRENATLSLGSDGNLVLADADGRIAWQTNTPNIGVVGFAILSDGNVVLRDSKGNFVWQSFDHPTDTLLIGQSLRIGGPYKLVSRESVTNNVNGAYSLVIEPKRLALYYKNDMRYWSPSFSELNRRNVMLANVTFKIAETDYVETYFHELEFGLVNARPRFAHTAYLVLGRIQYNSSLSYLRLGIDGNIRVYTYRRNVRTQAWTLLYTLFDKTENVDGGLIFEDECQQPNRCGNFGLCEDSQCVGCPTPNGVFAWSKDCDTKPPGCKPGGFTYYQLKGVDHFTVKYTAGNHFASRSDCESKCSKDCGCLGYFYHTDNSRCWIAHELKTLTRVGNSTHLAYIKKPVR